MLCILEHKCCKLWGTRIIIYTCDGRSQSVDRPAHDYKAVNVQNMAHRIFLKHSDVICDRRVSD